MNKFLDGIENTIFPFLFYSVYIILIIFMVISTVFEIQYNPGISIMELLRWHFDNLSFGYLYIIAGTIVIIYKIKKRKNKFQ